MGDSSGKRPVRSALEEATDKLSTGPLGLAGGGRVIGATNYFSVALINSLIPLDGLSVGYNVESHSVNRREDGSEKHVFTINSANKDVAEFIAQFQSPPSKLDYLTKDVDVEQVEKEKERSWFTTWRVVVEMDPRQKTETERL